MSLSEPPEIFVFGQFRLDRRTGGLFRARRKVATRFCTALDPVRARPCSRYSCGGQATLISKDEIMAAVSGRIRWSRKLISPFRSPGVAPRPGSGSGARELHPNGPQEGSYRFIAAVVQPGWRRECLVLLSQ